jgi:hypothetical protein
MQSICGLKSHTHVKAGKSSTFGVHISKPTYRLTTYIHTKNLFTLISKYQCYIGIAKRKKNERETCQAVVTL